jgi:hypothetical protein
VFHGKCAAALDAGRRFTESCKGTYKNAAEGSIITSSFGSFNVR